MIVPGTTAHPSSTQMASMGHALMAVRPTDHCFDSYKWTPSNPTSTFYGRLSALVGDSGRFAHKLAAVSNGHRIVCADLTSIPTPSPLCLTSLQKNQQHFSLLTWNNRKAPRTAPRIQTFQKCVWHHWSWEKVMCLLFSSRKKKLLCGLGHINEKGFNETSLKANNKKCQPKLALLLFFIAHHYKPLPSRAHHYKPPQYSPTLQGPQYSPLL